jgi:uncharacterized circularly permuted ATP-grasp superfamily protein/uncharacterized alpha-E superfamily protein
MTLEGLRYSPTVGGFDEVFERDGTPRATWAATARALGSMDVAVLQERQRQADRLLDAEGTGHLVHELSLGTDRHGVTAARSSRPWRLDPIPFVLSAAEFQELAAAATQRMRLLDALLADCYGPRHLVADGVLPAGLLHALPGYRPVPGSAVPARWLRHYSLDVVRDTDGGWHVVRDSTDTPRGLGYALLDRSVLARVVPDGMRSLGVAAIQDHADSLRRALVAAAPAGRTSPRSVVLTAGPADPTYVEHSYLATRLGLHLVESGDVVMRNGRLWLRVLDGLEPIDVVYRRVTDAMLDPMEAGHVGGGSGVPGLVWGERSGGVALANAYGSGLAEDPALGAHLGHAAQRLLGESLLLPTTPSPAALATSPVFVGQAAAPVQPRSVVLRMQVARVGDEFIVMPGGAAPVLAPGDVPRHPTAEMVKDVWVVGLGARVRPPTVTSPPQVDFGGSVPKRVADSLYWLGRAAERAEVITRAVRVVGTQFDQDPSLVSLASGEWTAGVCALLGSARAQPVGGVAVTGVPLLTQLIDSLGATTSAAAVQLGALLQEAASVREYLSTTTGRVLGRIAKVHPALSDGTATADELDGVLVDLAALSGLIMESTVRGPSWRFLDLGRRLERALAVVGSVEASLAAAVTPLAQQVVADAVLSANESLVAYRRRYRSDVDLHAVLDLLLRDDANPRSLAYQLDRLREHTAGLAWPDGSALVEAASMAALAHIDDTVVNGRRVSLDAFVIGVRGPLLSLAEAIVQRWFADPVNPTLVRGR